MTNRDRQIRARLSAIEVTKGIGNEWYEQRERLYQFQFETGIYTRTAPRADTVPTETRVYGESDGCDGLVIGSITNIASRRRTRGDK